MPSVKVKKPAAAEKAEEDTSTILAFAAPVLFTVIAEKAVVPPAPDIVWMAAPLKVVVPPNVIEPLLLMLPEIELLKVLPVKVHDELTVKEFMVKPTPKVVVPPEMRRLLKEVKIDPGKVLVAASSTVPAPGVNVEPEKTVMAPFILSNPPAVIFILLVWVAIVPFAKLPAIKVEPLVKVMAPTLFAFPLLPLVTAPETVKTGLPLLANVSVAVPFPVPIDNEAQVNAPLTVTVLPVDITTASPGEGTPPVVL